MTNEIEMHEENALPEDIEELTRKFGELQRKYNEKSFQLAGLTDAAIAAEKSRTGRENLYSQEVNKIYESVIASDEYKRMKQEERDAYEEMQNMAKKLEDTGITI